MDPDFCDSASGSRCMNGSVSSFHHWEIELAGSWNSGGTGTYYPGNHIITKWADKQLSHLSSELLQTFSIVLLQFLTCSWVAKQYLQSFMQRWGYHQGGYTSALTGQEIIWGDTNYFTNPENYPIPFYSKAFFSACRLPRVSQQSLFQIHSKKMETK